MANNTKFYTSNVDKYYFGTDTPDRLYFGASQIYQLLATPIISSSGVTDHDTIWFRVTNNSNVTVTVSYGVTSSANTYTTSVSANSLSGTIYINGLSQSTSYRIYVKFIYATTGQETSIVQSGILTTPSQVVQTTKPNITDYGYDALFSQYYWKVQNLDASSATIYSNANDSTPNTNRGTIASMAKTSTIYDGSSNLSITVYAKAQASGETLSAYDSQIIQKGK